MKRTNLILIAVALVFLGVLISACVGSVPDSRFHPGDTIKAVNPVKLYFNDPTVYAQTDWCNSIVGDEYYVNYVNYVAGTNYYGLTTSKSTFIIQCAGILSGADSDNFELVLAAPTP